MDKDPKEIYTNPPLGKRLANNEFQTTQSHLRRSIPLKTSVVDPDPHGSASNKKPDPHQIKIRIWIRVKEISWLRNRIRIKPKCMEYPYPEHC
jgi:hypothetical protein